MPRGRPRGRNFPGKPLPPDRIRFRLIPGDYKRRYIDLDTGQVVSRYYAESSIARTAGFSNLREYQAFTKQLGQGGLGGLSGLRGKDVLRAKHLMDDYEDRNGLVRGSIVRENPVAVGELELFMKTPFNRKREKLYYLARALDALGIRDFNPQLLPGESPTPKAKR